MAAQKTLERLVQREEREERRASTRAPSRSRRAAARRGRSGSTPNAPQSTWASSAGSVVEAAIDASARPRAGACAPRAAAGRPSRCSRAARTISKSRVARRRGYCASVSRMNGRYGSSMRGAARARAARARVVRDRRAHGVMVDAEGGGDGADLPVLAEIEAANLGVLLGRDHGAPPGTRDGSARAVEGATRFRGHRPCSATRPPGARSAIDPSTCQRAVWRAAPGGGKSDPSRARDTRVDDPDDRGGLPD